MRLVDAGFFGSDVVNELVKGCKFSGGVSAKDPDFDVIVSHSMDDDLLNNIVLIRDVSVACVTVDSHATHVSGRRNSCCKCPDLFVRFLGECPKIPEMNALVNCDDGQLFHLGEEQGICVQFVIVARVEYSLPQFIITCFSKLHKFDFI